MNEQFLTNNEPLQERPKGLLVLAILSWVNIGFSLITGLIKWLSGPLSSTQMKESKVEMLTLMNEMKDNGMDSFHDFFSKVLHLTEVFNQQHYYVYGLTVLFLIVGLLGVYFMFIGKKLGFHLYIIYCILTTLHVYFFLAPSEVPTLMTIWSIILSGLFIFLYSRHLSWLKA
ncbi:MAG: hypothetical protein KJ941_00560 [Bacteroidetes bacterium]|nr:hypothetical protein [Bacteroidota bacterium]